MPGYVVKKLEDVAPVPCPCGAARRILTAEDGGGVSIHRVSIRGEAQKHFHKTHDEYYVILSGAGEMELDDQRVAVSPGDVIMIPAGTRHALRGAFDIINVVQPPFDPADEFSAETTTTTATTRG